MFRSWRGIGVHVGEAGIDVFVIVRGWGAGPGPGLAGASIGGGLGGDPGGAGYWAAAGWTARITAVGPRSARGEVCIWSVAVHTARAGQVCRWHYVCRPWCTSQAVRTASTRLVWWQGHQIVHAIPSLWPISSLRHSSGGCIHLNSLADEQAALWQCRVQPRRWPSPHGSQRCTSRCTCCSAECLRRNSAELIL